MTRIEVFQRIYILAAKAAAGDCQSTTTLKEDLENEEALKIFRSIITVEMKGKV